MANDWCRLYAEFANDPKVQMMPEHMQRRLIMLFCERCSDVLVTLHETELAFHWRISDVDLAETKALFLAKGFIDDQWNLVNWDKRQFVSDHSSDRTRRYRERARTSQERHKNVTVTGSDGVPCDAVTKRDALDSDTDADTEKIKTLPSGKRSAAADSTPDVRHVACREQVHAYWHHRHPGESAAPWDASEAKALSRLLRAKPDLTAERFRQLLAIRARSDVNHDERPRAWLERLTDYAGGPLDRFKLPAQTAAAPGATVGMYVETRLAVGATDSTARAPLPKPVPLEDVVHAQALLHTREKRTLNENEQQWLDDYETRRAAFAGHIGSKREEMVSA